MKKKMAVISAVAVIALAAALTFVGFNKPNEKTQAQSFSNSETLSFEEAVALSDCIAIAQYRSHDRIYEYSFQVKEVLQGKTAEKEIHLFEYTEDGKANSDYIVGDDYLLIMTKEDSLFYDYPLYFPVSKLVVPLGHVEDSKMSGESFSAEAIHSLLEQLRNKPQRQAKTALQSAPIEADKPYISATDFTAIVNESDVILEVKVTDLLVEGIHNSATYTCAVQDVLAGGPIANSDGYIYITLINGSVKIGNTYIVMVNRVEKDSWIYTQSAKNGVIPVSDTEAVAQVKGIIAGLEE